MKSLHTLAGSRPCPSSWSGNTHQQSQGKGTASQMAGTWSFVSKLKLLASAPVKSVTMVQYPLPLPPPPSTRGTLQRSRARAQSTPPASAMFQCCCCYPEINLPWNAIVKEHAWRQVKITCVDTVMHVCAEQKSTFVQRKRDGSDLPLLSKSSAHT